MAGLGPLDRRFGLRPEGQPFGQTEARLTRLEAGGREDIFIVTDPLYGAVGDGVTDDTAAIQAAIDAAAAVRGTVWFPYSADEYMVSDTLTLASGVIIAGAGKRAVTIKLTAAFPLGHNLFDGTNVQDVKVRDLGFNGSDLVLTAKALLFSQSSTDKRCRIEHCLFEDFLGSYAVYCDSAWDFHIVDSEFEDCQYPMRFQNPNGHSTCLHNRITSSRELISLGILAFGSSQIDAPMLIEGNHVYDCGVDNGGVGAEGDGIQVSNCRGVRIIGNHVENTLWAGIRTGSGAFGAVISGNTCLKNRPGIYVELSINSTRAIDAAGERRGATVIGNTVDGDGQEDSSGIQISWAAGCVVEGNLVANTWSEGIYTDSDYTTIVGNKVQNSWMGGTPGGGLAQKAGIRCDQASDCVIVSNTCFDNQASPTQEYGIAVMDDNNIVAHNKIRGNAVGGLYQDSDGSSNFVFNNDDGRSVPPTIALSGNDLHVPAGEELVIVPGTTQINLIVAQRPGAKVTLLFEDVLVVNDGQYNIRLEGSVNMTTSANDTLSLVCDGTNWYETARTVI